MNIDVSSHLWMTGVYGRPAFYLHIPDSALLPKRIFHLFGITMGQVKNIFQNLLHLEVWRKGRVQQAASGFPGGPATPPQPPTPNFFLSGVETAIGVAGGERPLTKKSRKLSDTGVIHICAEVLVWTYTFISLGMQSLGCMENTYVIDKKMRNHFPQKLYPSAFPYHNSWWRSGAGSADC